MAAGPRWRVFLLRWRDGKFPFPGQAIAVQVLSWIRSMLSHRSIKGKQVTIDPYFRTCQLFGNKGHSVQSCNVVRMVQAPQPEKRFLRENEVVICIPSLVYSY
jgi:hypothetical protein